MFLLTNIPDLYINMIIKLNDVLKGYNPVVDQTQLCSESDLGHHQIGISISDIPNRNFRFGNTHVRNVTISQIQLGISRIRSETWSDLVHSIPQTQPYSKLT